MTATTLLMSGWGLRSTAAAIPWLIAEQTLCEQNTPFVPQVTIGSDPNSLTNSSSLPILYYSNQRIRINGTLHYSGSNPIIKV